MSAAFVFLQDRTSVIVGVKAELGASDPEAPDMGRIQFFVDWYVLSQIDKVGSRAWLRPHLKISETIFILFSFQ